MRRQLAIGCLLAATFATVPVAAHDAGGDDTTTGSCTVIAGSPRVSVHAGGNHMGSCPVVDGDDVETSVTVLSLDVPDGCNLWANIDPANDDGLTTTYGAQVTDADVHATSYPAQADYDAFCGGVVVDEEISLTLDAASDHDGLTPAG